MTCVSEREYLEKRYRACREKARAAVDPSLRLIHQHFADEYARRLCVLVAAI